MPEPSDINAELVRRGPEFMIGLDTERKWVNGVQIFPTNNEVVIVFREQGVMSPDGESEPVFLLKNVASVVMPMSVALELRKILDSIMPKGDNEAG